MEDNFDLNVHGWFTVENSAENEFLNSKLENDTYGIWYSVKFLGNAETFLWQTKTKPVEGEKYWGWLENTKSGKSVKFKWDKQNAPTTGSSPQSQPERPSVPHNDDKEVAITRAVALKAAVELHVGIDQAGKDLEGVFLTADKVLAWLKNEDSPKQPELAKPAVTGYQKSHQVRQSLSNGEPLPEPPEDLLGWIKEGEEHDND